MTKLTPAQAYALQVKADRRAAAAERRSGSIKTDNDRITAMYPTVAKKPAPTKAITRVRWSNGELDLLIELYLRHVDPSSGSVNRRAIFNQFAVAYPKRCENAVDMGISQIKGLDDWYAGVGLHGHSDLLAKKLAAVDANRFPTGLNMLLSELV